MNELKWQIGVALSLLSAGLLLFSFPPYNLNFLAFFALVPVLFVIHRSNLKKALGYSILFSFPFYCFLLFWMNAYMAVVGVAFVTVVYGSYFIITLMVINLTSRAYPRYRVIITPFIWIAIDYIRSFGFLGCTFGSIGYTQHNFPRFIQVADIGGEQLVSFILVLFNAGLTEVVPYLKDLAFKKRAFSSTQGQTLLNSEITPEFSSYYYIPFFISVILIVFSLIYGTIKLNKPLPDGPEMKISLIQGLSSPRTAWKSEKWKTLNRLTELSRESCEEHSDIDLIVWTETAIRTSLRPNIIHGSPYHMRIQRLIRELGTYFIIGSPDNYLREKEGAINPAHLETIYPTKDEEEVWTNSAYYLNPQGEIIDKYDKIQLTPFGEHFPLGKVFPALQKVLDRFTDSAGFTPGNRFTLFNYKNYRFGVVICWEGTYGYLIRNFVKAGADFIINISNDMWTKTEAGHFQHFTTTIFRAVENRIWFVRAGNDGVTAFINPYGIVENMLPIQKPGYLVGEIGPRASITFYTRYGNTLPMVSLVVSGASFIFSIFFLLRKRKRY
ncbi:MAG: apolipoprotein N-acyltransferase [Spirochaetota bacterium]